jgi:hypothetical protein
MNLRYLAIFLVLAAPLAPQGPRNTGMRGDPAGETDVKLPNGKSQTEAIIKADFEKSLKDAAELVELAEQLKIDLEKSQRHVVSVGAIRKTEEIEKIAKRIRSRLKRF